MYTNPKNNFHAGSKFAYIVFFTIILIIATSVGATYAYFTSQTTATLSQTTFGTLTCTTSVDGGVTFNQKNSVSLSSATDRQVLLENASMRLEASSQNAYARVCIGYEPIDTMQNISAVQQTCVALNSEVSSLTLYSCSEYHYEYHNGYFYLVDNSGKPVELTASIAYKIFDSATCVLAMPDIEKFNLANASLNGVKIIVEAQAVQSANLPLNSVESAQELDKLIVGANIFDSPITNYGKIIRYETLGAPSVQSTIFTGDTANITLPQVSGVDVTWYTSYEYGEYSGEVGVSNSYCTSINQSITLYAQYDASGVMVFFENADGEGTLPTNSLVKSGSTIITNKTLTKTGYTHNFWKNKTNDSEAGITKNAQGNININLNSFTLGTAITLVPTWTPTTYNANFVTTRGVIDLSGTTTHDIPYTIETRWNVDSGKTYPLVLLEDDETYKFIGWEITAIDSTSGTTYKVGEVITNFKQGMFGITGFNAVIAVRNVSESAGKTSIDLATTSVILPYTYTGFVCEPTPTVTLNGELLQRGTDYTLHYSNHKNAGTAQLVIMGINDYNGSISTSFTIVPKNIEDPTVSIDAIPEKNYTGSAIEPTPNIIDTYMSASLVNGTDYTLSYFNNIENPVASIIVTGKGNYTGTRLINFEIGQLNNPAVITAIGGLVYNAQPQDLLTIEDWQDVVYFSYDAPVNSTNIGAAFSTIPQQTNAGTYKIYYYVPEVRGYTDMAGELTVTLNKKPMTITAKDQTIVYGTTIATGTSYVNVSGMIDGHRITAVTLNQTITNAGTGYVEASAATFMEVNIDVTANYAITYKAGMLTINKKPVTITAKPQTIVYGTSISVGVGQVTHTELLDGHTLSSVALSPSTDAVTSNGSILPSNAVILNANSSRDNDNYEITYVSGKLTITAATLSVTVTLKTELTYNGQAQTPSLNVVKTSVNNQTITMKYKSSAGASYSTTIPTFTNAGSYTLYWEATAPNHNALTGTLAITVARKNISDASITVNSIPNQWYDFEPITLSTSVLVVKDGSKTMTITTEYTAAYANNDGIGTATITLTGVGNYQGTKTVTFVIDGPETIDYLTFTSVTGGYDVAKSATVALPASVTIPEYVVVRNSIAYVVESTHAQAGKVVTVKASGFSGATGLTSITMPSSITTIGASAFNGCTGLTTITIPAGVTSIGTSAFADCTKLTAINYNATSCADFASKNNVFLNAGSAGSGITLTIGAGITKLPVHFCNPASSTANAPKVIKIVFGKDVTSMTPTAFAYCATVEDIVVDEANTTLDSRNTCKGVVKKSNNTLVFGCKNTTYPSTVTGIASNAFCFNTGLTTHTVPNTVVSIASGAFNGCFNLTTLSLPFCGASPTATNADALFGYVFGTASFGGATATAQLYDPAASATTYYIPTKLTNVTITGGKINYGAFYNCSNIKVFTATKDVVCIGESAFYGCNSITTLYLPFVGYDGEHNYGMKKDLLGFIFGIVEFEGSIATYQTYATFYMPVSLTTVYVTDGNGIYANAFQNCLNLTHVDISNNIAYIAPGAFSGCGGLTSIVLPFCGISLDISYTSSDSTFGVIFGTASYTNGTRYACYYRDSTSYYQNYYLPTNLKNITINQGEIWNFFYNLTHITNITLGDKVLYVGGSAFYGCTGLTSVSIGDACTYIGYRAFRGCTALTSVTIGKSVTYIGNQAFYNTLLLKNIYYNAVECADLSTDNSVFYKAGSTNGGLALTVGDGVKRVPGSLFYTSTSSSYLHKLTTVTFVGTTCTEIGTYAFYYSTSLTTLKLPNSITSVGRYAFDNCTAYTLNNYSNANYVPSTNNDYFVLYKATSTSITSCTLHASTVVIADYAFYDCVSMTGELTITAAVKYIGHHSFDDCDDMTSVNIQGNVLTIGDYAFYDCTYMTTINIPNSIEKIGMYAFNNCSRLSYTTLIENVYYLGNSSKPQLVVWKVGSTNITNYNIAASTRIIMPYAFQNCYNVSAALSLSSNLVYVGDYAFDNCYRITSISFANANCKIGKYAFNNCYGAQTITLPTNLTRIEERTFYNCDGITSITLPANLTYIGASAFYGCNNLQTIAWSKKLNYIGDSAFYENSYLKNIEIPVGVTYLGTTAFSYTRRIETIYYNAKLLENNKKSNVFYYLGMDSPATAKPILTIGKDVERVPSSLFSVDNRYFDIGKLIFEENSSCFSIGYSAIVSRGSLEGTIILPDTIKSLGANAIWNTNLTNMYVSNSIAYIGQNALDINGSIFFESPAKANSWASDWYDARKVYYNAKTMGEYQGYSYVVCQDDSLIIIDYNGEETRPTIPSTINDHTVTTISPFAFYKKTNLTTIFVPICVTSIDYYVFDECSNLTIVCEVASKPDTWDSNWNPDNRPVIWGGKSLESSADYEYTIQQDSTVHITKYIGTATDITIPTTLSGLNVVELGTNSFYERKDLVSVTMPSTLKVVNTYAFYNCSSITTLNLNSGLLTIKSYAFRGLSKLNQLTLPTTLQTIESYGFYGCSKITIVHIPANVTSIGSAAFGGCGSLATITVDSANGTYEDAGKNVVITKSSRYLVAGCSSSVIPSDTVTIGSYAFYNVSGLTSVTLPSTLTTINTYAFGSSGITSITIPASVTYIGNYAFRNCDSLKTATFQGTGDIDLGSYAFEDCDALNSVSISGTGITTIPNSCFSDCVALTSITLPSSLQHIDNNAFSSSGLTSITIPANVLQIDDYAFGNCANLTKVSFNSSTLIEDISYETFMDSDNLTYYTTGNGCYLGYPSNSTYYYLVLLFMNSSTISSFSINSYCRCIGHDVTDTYSYIENGNRYFASGVQYTITSCSVPSRVRIIGDSFMSNADFLTSVSIGSGVVYIYSNVFYDCDYVSSYTFSATNCTYIGNSCFTYFGGAVESGVSITISSGVTRLYDGVVGSSSKVRTLYFGGMSSLRTIYSNWFNGYKISSSDYTFSLSGAGSYTWYSYYEYSDGTTEATGDSYYVSSSNFDAYFVSESEWWSGDFVSR